MRIGSHISLYENYSRAVGSREKATSTEPVEPPVSSCLEDFSYIIARDLFITKKAVYEQWKSEEDSELKKMVKEPSCSCSGFCDTCISEENRFSRELCKYEDAKKEREMKRSPLEDKEVLREIERNREKLRDDFYTESHI